MKININKYWIGYLTGILIAVNIFSAGVILNKTLSLNWIYFFWIWLVSLIPIVLIAYLREKQLKREKEKIV